HEDDEIAALTFLLRNDISGPVNLTGPTPATNAEFTRALGKSLNRPAVFTVPKAALRVAVGELADEILQSQHLVPKVLLDNGFQFTHGTIDNALAALARR
nr:DUF1731 domain-containing protein [Actinomycetota bacterium]